MKNKIQIIENYVKLLKIRKFAHGFDHTGRVRNWMLKIAIAERYPNMDIVEAAALLHDIGRSRGDGDHGEIGAQLAQEFLLKNNLFASAEVQEIVDAVKFHNKNRKVGGKLLDMLRDADILDLLGATGILRETMADHHLPMFNFQSVKGETWGMSARDFDKRIVSGEGKGDTISDQLNFQISCYENIKTDFAKKMAEPMVEFMCVFLKQLEKEAKQK